MKIYIARHGQDQDNSLGILNGHRDTPLTSLGIEQANKLKEIILNSNLYFNKVLSSPLQRAYRTAEIISDGMGLPKPEKLELLIERNFGIMTGKMANEIRLFCGSDILKTNTITYFLSPEGAETFPELIKRANKLLEYLDEYFTDQSILLVTHGDFGKMLFADFYNLQWQDVLQMFHFGNSDLLLLSKDISPEQSQIFQNEQYNH